ncbi:MAG: helix-turn-helix domain-containing protein [Saprospiraceae bacterium]
MFPTFGSYSTPLTILYLWGLLFTLLLLWRYFRQKNISDLFLAGVLFVHTYERTIYTIGFLSWYDNFPNTKINYFLISTSFIFGPLVYFYVKSVTQTNFKFKRQDYWHFLPQALLTLGALGVYLYDSNQAGFWETQNGKLVSTLSMQYINLFCDILGDISIAIYLFLAIQMERRYRKKIRELFSSLFSVELGWLRNFLAIFTLLFLSDILLNEINDNIVKMGYKDFWWIHLAAGLSLIYLGIYGYFLDIKKLHDINIGAGAQTLARTDEQQQLSTADLESQKRLHQFMEAEKPYLNPSLTLAKLAEAFELNANLLSQIINKGEGMNFNDFINAYRVKEVQQMIIAGKADQFTLLTLAYEAGFNSKATFNRTFKKFTQLSPSEFLKKATKKDA